MGIVRWADTYELELSDFLKRMSYCNYHRVNCGLLFIAEVKAIVQRMWFSAQYTTILCLSEETIFQQQVFQLPWKPTI